MRSIKTEILKTAICGLLWGILFAGACGFIFYFSGFLELRQPLLLFFALGSFLLAIVASPILGIPWFIPCLLNAAIIIAALRLKPLISRIAILFIGGVSGVASSFLFLPPLIIADRSQNELKMGLEGKLFLNISTWQIVVGALVIGGLIQAEFAYRRSRTGASK